MIIPQSYSRLQVAIILFFVIISMVIGGLFLDAINIRETLYNQKPMPEFFFNDNDLYDSLSIQTSEPIDKYKNVDSEEDIIFLESVIDDIFPSGYKNLSEERKVIEIGKYTTVILKNRNNGGTATKILKDGYAICGGKSIVFQNLLKTIGIPSRWVGIFIPNVGSHAIAEAFYDGQWHLFDPTYGVFFYSEPVYNLKGNIPSLSQLVSNHDYNLFFTTEHLWMGDYNSSVRNETIRLVQENSLEDFVVNFSNRYKSWFEIAEPVAYKNEQTCSFPVNVNFIDNTNISIGIINSDIFDNSTNSTQDTVNFNLHYIGLSSPKSIHTWFIMSPSEGYFNVSYYSTTNSNTKISVLPLKSINILNRTLKNNETEYILHTKSNLSSFMILCESGTYSVDAIKANWLGKFYH